MAMEFFGYFDRNSDTKLGRNVRKYFHFKVVYENCVKLTNWQRKGNAWHFIRKFFSSFLWHNESDKQNFKQ